MIKTPESMDNLKLNIFLTNGKVFRDKDTTTQPLGDNETSVSFWHNDKLLIYPLEQVEHIEMIF